MSVLKIVADQNMCALEHYFAPLGIVRQVDGRKLVRADLQDADVLLVRSVTRVEESLLAGTAVRFVGTATSGYDHIDRAYLERESIGFAYAPGSNANSVVEYVLAAIAATGRKLEHLLAGGELGIVGCGNIGKALVARCDALGIACQVYDPLLPAAQMKHRASLARVLDCAVVSVHAELTRRGPWPSYHMIGEEHLASLDSQTLLINAGRGELLDTAALLRLRRRDRGPKSILDVWESEPQINPELLRRVELGSAHIAGYSLDGKRRATAMLSAVAAQHFELNLPSREVRSEPPATLQVPAGLRGAQLLRWALCARYDIRADDRALRNVTIGAVPVKAAADFDTLRKTYRERRELLGSPVTVQRGENAQVPLLQALGCLVEEARA